MDRPAMRSSEVHQGKKKMAATDDKRFYGSKALLLEIVQRTLGEQPQNFALVGPRYLGKTRILRHLASHDGPLFGDEWSSERPGRFADGTRVITVLVDCSWPEVKESFLDALAQRVTASLRSTEAFPLDWKRIEEVDRPSRKLVMITRQLHEQGYRLIIMLDNFDALLDAAHLSPEELDELRPLAPTMVLIVALHRSLADTDLTRFASALLDEMHQVFVPLLTLEEASQWLTRSILTNPPHGNMLVSLLDLAGGHPFLLSRLANVWLDLEASLAGPATVSAGDFDFIRLRLAEHGRLLFTYLRQTLSEPPSFVRREVLAELTGRLMATDGGVSTVPGAWQVPLNWLINQRIVIRTADGYRFFTPLFAEFLRTETSAGSRLAAVAKAAPPKTIVMAESLPTIEAQLLAYLFVETDRVVSLEELLREVWRLPEDSESTRRVQEAIRRLRQRLQQIDPPIGQIENERGRGYRFVPHGS